MKMPSITVISELQAEEDQLHPKGKVEKKAGKRVGYNYIIVKSYKESQKNDVVKCLYIKSLTDWGFCVIKEGSYGDTKDKDGRDIIDRLKWQKQLHEQLHSIVPIPRLLGYFEERGNYYLVMEHFKGKPLQKVFGENRKEWRTGVISGNKTGKKVLTYLIQIAEILAKLHASQIVHRDATPNNYMVMAGGKVTLIDLEMCYSLKDQHPTPAFALGTHGYMSEQQEKISIPTTAEDIFALGAIFLQVWSGVSPGKLIRAPFDELTNKIQFFIPDKEMADLVIQCLHPDDQQRPEAEKVLEELKKYKNDLDKKNTRSLNKSTPFTQEEILETIQQSVNVFSTPLLADEEKGWFSNDMEPAPPGEDKHKLRKQWYASYNRGGVGIVYMLIQAKKVGLDVGLTLPYVQKSLDLIRDKYINRIKKKSGGLHFGADGIAAVLASALQHGLLGYSGEYLEWIELLLQKKTNTIGMLNGVAGQGIANLICRPMIDSTTGKQRLIDLVQLISKNQQPDGSWSHGYTRSKYTKRKKAKVLYGFGYGMAGTISFLIEIEKSFPGETMALSIAIKGLEWLMKKSAHKKGAIYWRNSKNEDLSYNWSDGIAGIALAFIRAYEYTGNDTYKQYATGALRGINATITDSNISQVSGLSGLGEVYLEAYQTFHEQDWIDRAGWLVQVIMQQKKQQPKYGPYWLVISERQPVGNFMIGNAGVVHFLLRYCFPEAIGFPLMP